MNEELLDAWLRLSSAIINERVVSDLSYNESIVCNLLYRHGQKHAGAALTATDLCRKTRMQKSLMNRTLTSLENRKLVIRERSEQDRRQIYVRLNADGAEQYQKQHERILALIDALMERIGAEHAEEIVRLFTQIAETAEEMIQ